MFEYRVDITYKKFVDFTDYGLELKDKILHTSNFIFESEKQLSEDDIKTIIETHIEDFVNDESAELLDVKINGGGKR